jgi:hypothetical protein
VRRIAFVKCAYKSIPCANFIIRDVFVAQIASGEAEFIHSLTRIYRVISADIICFFHSFIRRSFFLRHSFIHSRHRPNGIPQKAYRPEGIYPEWPIGQMAYYLRHTLCLMA